MTGYRGMELGSSLWQCVNVKLTPLSLMSAALVNHEQITFICGDNVVSSENSASRLSRYCLPLRISFSFITYIKYLYKDNEVIIFLIKIWHMLGTKLSSRM